MPRKQNRGVSVGSARMGVLYMGPKAQPKGDRSRAAALGMANRAAKLSSAPIRRFSWETEDADQG